MKTWIGISFSGLFAVLVTLLTNTAIAVTPENTPKAVTGEQLAAEIQHNVQFLASQSLSKAKALMEAYGDFAPFGAGLFPNGEVKYVWAVQPGEETKGINPALVLNSIRRALKAQADEGRILGSAIVYRFVPKGNPDQNQINVELEYLTGFARVLGTQYEVTDAGHQYGEGAFKRYEPVIFSSKQSNSGKSESQSSD